MTIKLSSVHSESALEIICPGTYLLILNVGQTEHGAIWLHKKKEIHLKHCAQPVHCTYLPPPPAPPPPLSLSLSYPLGRNISFRQHDFIIAAPDWSLDCNVEIEIIRITVRDNNCSGQVDGASKGISSQLLSVPTYVPSAAEESVH